MVILDAEKGRIVQRPVDAVGIKWSVYIFIKQSISYVGMFKSPMGFTWARVRNLDFFGMFNQKYAGRKYRYAYSAVPEPYWFLRSGLEWGDYS